MPQQFTLETGARYAAELLHAWVLRVAAESRAAALPTLAGAAPLYRAAPATAVCFSFDDQFDGQISPPRILRNVDWTEVKYETGRSGERKLKPGLASSVHGAVLELDKKPTTSFRNIAAAVKAAGAEENVIFISYNDDQAAEIAAINPDLMMTATAYGDRDVAKLERRGVDRTRLIGWTGTDEPKPAASKSCCTVC